MSNKACVVTGAPRGIGRAAVVGIDIAKARMVCGLSHAATTGDSPDGMACPPSRT